ncbi:MAG TPA: hypothetical protein VFE58_06565 [Tepidisphaeraceae bacterium]|nr:hypothetical protein [Tepidisphaeraceae bacterium]
MAIERDRDLKRDSDDISRDMVRDANKAHPDRNPDPITGAPGSHPVGTGIGAAGAGVAGVAIGTAVGGPVGSVVGGAIGAVVGAVAGGLAGKGVAEAIDPTTEDAYWRDNYSSRAYVRSGARYDEYQPAYRYGWESRKAHMDKSFDQAEPTLAQSWSAKRGSSMMSWDQARPACQDAWNRCGSCNSAAESDINQANLGQDQVL